MTNEERAREAAKKIAEHPHIREYLYPTERGRIAAFAEATILSALDAACADLVAERARLREALRPFAEFADRFGDHAREDNWVLTRNPSGKGNLTMGDVRHARSALAEKEPG